MINLEVKIPDTPGSLIELIKPISQNGGNIYGILHFHDQKLNNMIPVNINFELIEDVKETSLQKIKLELKEKKIQIVNVSFGIERKSIIILLTGHVFGTDILDTLQRLAYQHIKVIELHAKFTEFEEISNVKLKIEFSEEITKKEIINEIRKICEEKKLFLITN